MNVAQIRKYDIANGEGIRTSIFVSGCTHHCPNCFNGEYQDFSYGKPWTDRETREVISDLKDPQVAGLTLLGGEPMQNLELTQIIAAIRREVDKPIWIYSGYTFEQILADPAKNTLLSQCQVLVDGLFVEAKKDLTLAFRGSSNQRVIDIPKSLQAGHAVLYHLDGGQAAGPVNH